MTCACFLWLLGVCNSYCPVVSDMLNNLTWVVYDGKKNVCYFDLKITTEASPVADLFLSRKHWTAICYLINILVSSLEIVSVIKRQLMKFYANATTLLRKFGKCSVNIKLELFKTYATNLYCGIFGMMPLREVCINYVSHITAYNNSF